jgi:tetratricopeptide (TPR) repeat protein
MDELEFAKRAIRRNLLSEEQLREAQAYAQGGRPLLAVLLDLGFLKPSDLPSLFAPAGDPPAAGRGRSPFVAAAIVAAFLAAAGIGLVTSQSSKRPAPPAPPRVVVRDAPPPPPLHEKLAALAADHLADAERQVRDMGSFTPPVRERLARAAALYEEAIRERPDDVELRLQLGRARELLDQWELALQIFRQVSEAHPENGPARVGAARCLLLLQRHGAAYSEADRACAAAPSAEAYLVRGRALMSLGRADAARSDFLEAQRRDRSLAPVVGPLLARLKE